MATWRDCWPEALPKCGLTVFSLARCCVQMLLQPNFMKAKPLALAYLLAAAVSLSPGCSFLDPLDEGTDAVLALLGLAAAGSAPSEVLFSPAAGTFTQGQLLTISSAGASGIRYTTDGSEPTASSGTLYTGSIQLRTGTVKALAYGAGGATTLVKSAAYKVRATTFDVTVRDFLQSHPDFEAFTGNDLGVVATTLGSDGTPTYASGGTTATTTGAANFYHWFHDVSANVKLSVTLPIAATPVVCYYNSASFFPIDGQGHGNEAMAHNFFFTTQTRIGVLVEDGTVISVTGDDDWWVFLNGKRAIDLGGVHGATTGTVTLDTANRATYGVTIGDIVRVDIFQAERHTTQSNFRISISSECYSMF